MGVKLRPQIVTFIKCDFYLLVYGDCVLMSLNIGQTERSFNHKNYHNDVEIFKLS